MLPSHKRPKSELMSAVDREIFFRHRIPQGHQTRINEKTDEKKMLKDEEKEKKSQSDNKIVARTDKGSPLICEKCFER